MKDKKVTIREVAERAGVSKSVVSIVLSGRNSTIRVSEETRKKVLKAVRETRYQPNLMARGLFEKKTFLIAYLCTGGSGWGISTRMLRSIQQACFGRDYSLLVYPSESLEEERLNLRAAQNRQADGIIVSPLMIGTENNQESYRKVAESGISIVQIGNILSGISSINRDFRQIVEEGLDHLRKNGCRKTGFLTYSNYVDPVGGPTSHEEYLAYSGWMKQSNSAETVLPVSFENASFEKVYYKGLVMELCCQQVLPLLKKKNRPDSLLASSNSLACGACLAAEQCGLKIPEDLAIVSCSDDFMIPERFLPGISCFPLDAKEIGKQAVELCLNPSATIQNVRIKQNFKEGNTTKKV